MFGFLCAVRRRQGVNFQGHRQHIFVALCVYLAVASISRSKSVIARLGKYHTIRKVFSRHQSLCSPGRVTSPHHMSQNSCPFSLMLVQLSCLGLFGTFCRVLERGYEDLETVRLTHSWLLVWITFFFHCCSFVARILGAPTVFRIEKRILSLESFGAQKEDYYFSAWISLNVRLQFGAWFEHKERRNQKLKLGLD